MLAKLIKFIKENYPKSELQDWLDSKYIQLSDAQLKKIADAIATGELITKPASTCPAQQLIFHFGQTLILIKKDNSNQSSYICELAWETDFQAIHSKRDKDKGFHFINFSFDDDFQAVLLPTEKSMEGVFVQADGDRKIVDKILPVLQAFISAIS